MKLLLIYINAAMKATYTKETFTGSEELLTASIAYTLQAWKVFFLVALDFNGTECNVHM